MAFHPVKQPGHDDAILRILLVEDSDIDRDLVRRLLTIMWPRRDELQIEFASEGYEALDMIRATSYALILLDWRLPGMGGGAFLAALERTGCRLPVVVLTGLDPDELKVNIEEYGAVYLHKDDLNISTLHQSIAAALSIVLLSEACTPLAAATPSAR